MSTLRTNQIGARTGDTVSMAPGTQLYLPGSVIQVAFSSSGPVRQVINSLNPVIVSGLSLSFAPTRADSLIVVQAQIMSNLAHVSSFGVFQNGAATVSTAGQTNNNEPNMNVTTYNGSAATDELWCIPVMWSGAAGSTLPRTYDVRGTAGWAGTTYNLCINNRNSNDMAGFSTMMVMEVAQ